MKITNKPLALTALLALPSLTACSYVGYTSPEKEERVNADYGRTDVQSLVRWMADSMEGESRLSGFQKEAVNGDARPILYFGGIRNDTGDHNVNTRQISDRITELLFNQKVSPFRIVVEPLGQVEIDSQKRFQHNSGNVDPSQASAMGRQLGADIVVFGTISGIEKKQGRAIDSLGSKVKDVYFDLNMKAADIETGELLWAESREISKRERVSLFGA